jgi:hypothetical protein
MVVSRTASMNAAGRYPNTRGLQLLLLVCGFLLVLRQALLGCREEIAMEAMEQKNLQEVETALHEPQVLRENPLVLKTRQAAPSHLLGYEFNETWNAVSIDKQDRALVVPSPDVWLIDSPPRNQTSVPKVIYKAILSHGGMLPDFQNQSAQLRDAHESWILRNPGYELRYFDLITIRQYFARYFHPVFLRAFDCIEAYAGKSDFFRSSLLYREGGWYSDWKELCLEDGLLDKLSNNGQTLVFPWDRGTPHSRSNECVMMAFMGATERHPSK